MLVIAYAVVLAIKFKCNNVFNIVYIVAPCLAMIIESNGFESTMLILVYASKRNP